MTTDKKKILNLLLSLKVIDKNLKMDYKFPKDSSLTKAKVIANLKEARLNVKSKLKYLRVSEADQEKQIKTLKV